ncbi:MAG: peptidylprolyl isomerase [Candidatus Delongbacteria bacterium]
MNRILLPLLLWLGCAGGLQAAPIYVTRAQARDYLAAQGVSPDQQVQDGVLQGCLQEIQEHTLLALAWERNGRKLNAEQLAQLAQARDEIAVQLCRERRLRVAPLTPNQLQDYEFLSRALYLTSHILVDEKARADELAARLQQGGSFPELARQFSKDQGSASQGGSLGLVKLGQTVMEFEEALLRLKPGQVSPPVETPFGWHLIRLDSLLEREIVFTPQELSEQREILERHARRRAELEAQRQLWRQHRIELFRDKALDHGVPAGDLVARTADTTLTRGQLDQMLRKAFGAKESLATDGLGWDFLRYWVEQDAWLREARHDGTWSSQEVNDLVDLRERLLKSTLCVVEDIVPLMNPADEDLWNYLSTHELEFLAERAFGVWIFEFASREAAEAARALSRKEKLDPARLAKRLGLDLHPQELSAETVRGLPAALRSELIDLNTDEWSDILDNGRKGADRRWLFYNLVGRRMPDLDESASLKRAVLEKVRTAMIDAELGRLVDEMKHRTGLTEVRWK